MGCCHPPPHDPEQYPEQHPGWALAAWLVLGVALLLVVVLALFN